ncbi:MAG: AsnC family transcriptional regulator [Nitrososphaerales archaeon]
MDKLDIAIIRELTQGGLILPGKPGFTPSYRDLSKKLGIPFGTIRNRINNMYKLEFLKGTSMYPNPNLFKWLAGAYTLIVPPELNKAQVFDNLKSVEGFLSAHNFLGNKAWITFVYRDVQDLERTLNLIKKIAGPVGTFSRIPFPPCPDSITEAEARLMLHLSKNGLASYAELGKSLNLSTRTIMRRISKLSRENMIVSLAKLDYSKIAGAVPADLLIFFENDKARAAGEPKVLDLVKDYLLLAALFDVVGMCSLVLPNAILLKELAEKVGQIDGLKESSIDIVVEHAHDPKVLVQQLEKQLTALKTQG